MLTPAQTRTVCLMDNDGPICPECAKERYSVLAIARAEAGLTAVPVRPMSQYELDEYQVHRSEDEDDDALAAVECDCGEVLAERWEP